jgi:hypothetical protein
MRWEVHYKTLAFVSEIMNLTPEEIVEYFEKKSGTASAKTSA